MKATMILADHATATPDGKLYINGGGWTIIGAPIPFGIGLMIEVPWDQANDKHQFQLELVDSDGGAVLVPGPQGDQPLAFGGEFETGRPPGLKKGTPLPFVLAVNFPPPPLDADSRYEWRLTVDDESDEDWRLTFSTAPTWTKPG